MTQLRIKSHAKINLALNITGKSYSLHKIETIVSFISLHDEIFIKKINSKKHNIIFTGKFSRNIGKDNTISKKRIKFNNKIIHQSKLLNHFIQDFSKKKTEKDLRTLLKNRNKYFFQLKI